MGQYISILAIVISVGTLCWTIWYNLRQRQASALTTSLSAFVDVESKLGDIPKALQFHGVDPHDLERLDISPEEFSYLLTNFTAGGIYYRISNAYPDVPYQKGTYRYNMLKASKTRKAWPILQKFIEPSPYRDKLEITLKTIEVESQQVRNTQHIEED